MIRFAAFLTAVLATCAPSLFADHTVAVIDETPIEPFDLDHWAFQQIKTPDIPEVADEAWSRTPVDRFILARLEATGLRPAGRADRRTLIRRLTFDLHGLPPTVSQVAAFVDDSRPDAYGRLMDRLLASPQYGRHWAQHWLDLARFAETDGFEHDKIRAEAWKYRDWVVEAMNGDMPLDEFVAVQIAGDLIAPQDQNAAIPTMFCLSGPDMPDINSQQERKHVLMNELTSTVGSVLLSLQMGCAQCHDHKYDAISQADFYRLRAFFDPAVKLASKKSVTALSISVDATSVSRLFLAGDWRRPGPVLEPAFPRIANEGRLDEEFSDPKNRRLALARWLTGSSNPLTARSIVNRVWQFHFGHGISRTPSDFGVMGDDPSHPELIDHLATELVRRKWSLKSLHRAILSSAVYQTQGHRSRASQTGQNKSDWTKALREDPDNRLLSRFPRRRLSAEAIRDSILAISGAINFESGGPGVYPPLPPEMIKTLLPGQWRPSLRRADHYRRSVYVFARRNLRYPLFATFDRPAANCSCAVRDASTTAVQSLSLLNSEFTFEAAALLAGSIVRRPGSASERVDELYRRFYSRYPDKIESRRAIEFLDQQAEMVEGPDGRAEAIADLCRAMFNSNEFLYVD